MFGNDANVKLLVHFDGGNGSTSFFDNSPVWPARPTAHTMTAFGTGQVDTSTKVFGSGSGKFQGLNAQVTTPDSSEFNLSNAVFTFDFRIRPNTLVAANHPIISQQDGAGGGWIIYYDDLFIYFQAAALTTGAVIGLYRAPHIMSTLTWYHWAIHRATGTQMTFFRNGLAVAVTRVDNLSNKAVPHPSTALTIGSTATLDCDGWIDEMRMSPGVVRWTGPRRRPSPTIPRRTRTCFATKPPTATLRRPTAPCSCPARNDLALLLRFRRKSALSFTTWRFDSDESSPTAISAQRVNR